MLKRLTVTFTSEECEALERMAEEDFRPPKEQLRWLLRREAEGRGLMPCEPEKEEVVSSEGYHG